MAVNFNKPTCLTVTTEKAFGICDDEPPPAKQAYLDFENSDTWIAWVDNNDGKEVKFTAIDNCVEIRRANGEQESRCDGMLTHDRTIAFVELKDRDSGRWLGDATDQLKMTIKIYKAELGLTSFDRYFACVVNKQRPNFKAASTSFSQKFEDETDFVLMIEQVIKID